MANTQAKEWIKSGYADLKTIGYMIDDEFLTHMVAFHSQQSIEKSLKAILENEQKRVPKVHKLQNLIARIDTDISFDDEMVEILDELYIDSRYPGDMGLLPHGKPTLQDAQKFYRLAQDTFDEICTLLQIDIDDIL